MSALNLIRYLEFSHLVANHEYVKHIGKVYSLTLFKKYLWLFYVHNVVSLKICTGKFYIS